MRTLHRVMMAGVLALALAVAAGALYPLVPAAEAQHGAQRHGQAADPDAHFNEVAARLQLTDAQRTALAEPLSQAFAAMQQLHALHETIAAELTDAQKEELAKMMHEGMEGASMHGRHGHGEGRH